MTTTPDCRPTISRGATRGTLSMHDYRESTRRFFPSSLFLSAILLICAPQISAQQPPSMSGMPAQHEHTAENPQPSRSIEFPRLGRAQSNTDTSLFTLDHALET